MRTARFASGQFTTAGDNAFSALTVTVCVTLAKEFAFIAFECYVYIVTCFFGLRSSPYTEDTLPPLSMSITQTYTSKCSWKMIFGRKQNFLEQEEEYEKNLKTKILKFHENPSNSNSAVRYGKRAEEGTWQR